MGIGSSEVLKEDYVNIRKKFEMFEITDENGYLLCNKYFLPEEVLVMILSYVPSKDLVFICRRVCKYWCNIIDSQVWKKKLEKNNVPPYKIHELQWLTCFWILTKVPLNRNLIKNNCGQDGLQFWEVLSCGGNGWIVEKPPVGCEDFPKTDEFSKDNIKDILQQNSCFATSYYSCTKKQLIDLKKEGAYPELMDKLQPQITITDWCCGRYDCHSVYDLKVSLLNDKHQSVADFEVRKHLGSADGWAWQKVTHAFLNYGPGVKFIEFYHGGMDSQFWKGHYGSKMTGALVSLSLL